MQLLNPRAYMAGSAAHRVLQWFRAPRYTASDIISARPADRQVMYTVEDVRGSATRRRVGLAKRHRNVTRTQTAPAHQALSTMLKAGVTSVVVVKAGDPSWVHGLITTTDYLTKVSLPEGDAQRMRCQDIATPIASTAYVLPNNDLESCMAVMAAMQVHHLPVLDTHSAMAHAADSVPSAHGDDATDAESHGQQPSEYGCVTDKVRVARSSSCADPDAHEHETSDAPFSSELLGVVSLQEIVGLNRAARELSTARFHELTTSPTQALSRILAELRPSPQSDESQKR